MIVIIGFILGVIILVISICKGEKERCELAVVLICVVILIEVFGFMLQYEDGFEKYYQDWELNKETKLVSLSNTQVGKGGGMIYVSISAENVYSYRYEIDSKFGTETSKEYTVDVISGNVDEIEDVNCKIPVLREYKSKFSIGVWRIRFPGEAKMYVFYVPEGTIQKEISLK